MITRLDDHQDQRGWDILSAATGGLAFDVGGNIGQAAKVLAKSFDRVVSLEPCMESYRILRDETPENVLALPLAAWSHTGRTILTETAYSITTGQLTNGTGLRWGDVTGTRVVRCVTLDSLLDEYGEPDFVKIDTEGAELEVLRGAEDVFCDIRPQVIVEVHRREHEREVRAHLAHYDLAKLTHGPYGPVDHFWIVGEARKHARTV